MITLATTTQDAVAGQLSEQLDEPPNGASALLQSGSKPMDILKQAKKAQTTTILFPLSINPYRIWSLFSKNSPVNHRISETSKLLQRKG